MNHHKTTSRHVEHGSLATFLIIGAVLLLAMAGVAYTVTQRSDSNVADRPNDSTAVEEEQNGGEIASNGEDEGVDSEDEGVERDDESLPDDEEDQGSTAPQAGPTEELPQAGPGEAMFSIASLALLAYAILRYTQSRQQKSSDDL